MATLIPTLTLISSDATSDALNFTVTDSLTTGSPILSLSRTAAEASSGSGVALLASSIAGNKYFYIKHTALQSDGSTASTGDCIVSIAGNDSIRLAPGEFGFFPIKASLSLSVQSNTSHTIIVEYAYWTKG